jgi:hypothetical protein
VTKVEPAMPVLKELKVTKVFKDLLELVVMPALKGLKELKVHKLIKDQRAMLL